MILNIFIILIGFYLLNKYLLLIMRYIIADILDRDLKYGIIGMIKADIIEVCDCVNFYEFISKASFYMLDVLLSPIIFVFLLIQFINLKNTIKSINYSILRKDIYNQFDTEDLDAIFKKAEDDTNAL